MAGGSLSEIITISITRQTAVVAQAGFGKPMVMGDLAETFNEGYPAGWVPATTPYHEYATLTEMAADGFDPAKAIYMAATELFAQERRPSTIAVGFYDSATPAIDTITKGLNALSLVDNSWYGLLCTDRTNGNAGDPWECAQWVESASPKKLFVAASDDVNTYNNADASSLAYEIQNEGYNQSAVIYSGDAALTITAAGWADAAWLGRMLPTNPGSATWAFKKLTGISPDDGLTSAERAEIWGSARHNANTYNTVADNSITRYGTVGSGEFLDVIRGINWLEARISERIYERLITLAKVPYTQAGIDIILAAIRAVLEEGIRVGLLASIDALSAPKVGDISAANKGLRLLPDIEFTCTLAGAIHKTTLAGIVTL